MGIFSKLPPLWGVSIKFGLVAAALNIALMLLLFYTGKHPLLIPPYMDGRIIVFLIFIYFTIREFRDSLNEGILHYWQGFLLGFGVYVTVGILGSIFVMIFNSIDPTFLTSYIEKTAAGMEAAYDEMVNGPQKVKMSDEQFQQNLTALKATTSGILAIDYFIKTCLMGFLVPLIYSVFLRNVPK